MGSPVGRHAPMPPYGAATPLTVYCGSLRRAEDCPPYASSEAVSSEVVSEAAPAESAAVSTAALSAWYRAG